MVNLESPAEISSSLVGAVSVGKLGDADGPLLRSHHGVPLLVDGFLCRDAGDLGPARVRVHVSVLHIGLEDADGRGVGEEPQLVGGGLHFPGSRCEYLRVHEHRDLGPQLVGGTGAKMKSTAPSA